MNKVTIESLVESFAEKVNDLRRDMPQGNDKDGPMHEFGFKTLRIVEGKPEVFTVTDFGNIKKWLRQSLTSLLEEIEEEITNKHIPFRADMTTVQEFQAMGYNTGVKEAAAVIKARLK